MQADGPGGRWGGQGSAGGRGPLKYALLRGKEGRSSRFNVKFALSHCFCVLSDVIGFYIFVFFFTACLSRPCCSCISLAV